MIVIVRLLAAVLLMLIVVLWIVLVVVTLLLVLIIRLTVVVVRIIVLSALRMGRHDARRWNRAVHHGNTLAKRATTTKREQSTRIRRLWLLRGAETLEDTEVFVGRRTSQLAHY